MRHFNFAPTITWLAILAIAAVVPTVTVAGPTHRYSFTTDANDSVGTAHGTVVDAGAPTAVFAGGQLDLSANTGQGSNGITEDAYVNFPNGLISSAANAGASGQLTIEFWARSAENRNWAAIFSAGTSNGGEDQSPEAPAADYIQIIPQNGANQRLRTTTHAANVGAEGFVDFTAPLSTAADQHVVTVYDQSNGLPGTVRMYVDGALIGTAAIANNLNIGTMNDNNVWLGRSQWNDSVFDGSVDELRVYDRGLAAPEVQMNFQNGPNTVTDLLTVEVNKTNGQVTLKNNAPFAIAADFYRLSSAASALSLAGWNSLDTQNYDAVDGTDGGSTAGDSVGEGWDKAGGASNSQLIEYFLEAAGSSIAANETLSLGAAYNKNVFGAADGDLQFTLGIVGGTQITASVTYITSGAIAGDYNGNGTVDAADYTRWRDTLGQNVAPGSGADGSGNGVVGSEDYTFWKQRFGSGGSGGLSGAPVPEPTSLGLLFAVLVTCGLNRRNRN